ncbi:hypothetical protein CDL62_07680 [Alkalitalea saponilacus]|uniref:Uncharacterized protein n=1 Tax=Alkalitalea saponilacus TaxID=889453 RepID=A0A1T5EDA5_9BACT|nr:hypothetical protein CDL62_07680 [Alkalitalea saponilacus]SKB81906.1 hypothetical protein SAMN03080601_01297 [Alkalitalea saponilacus]
MPRYKIAIVPTLHFINNKNYLHSFGIIIDNHIIYLFFYALTHLYLILKHPKFMPLITNYQKIETKKEELRNMTQVERI